MYSCSPLFVFAYANNYLNIETERPEEIDPHTHKYTHAHACTQTHHIHPHTHTHLDTRVCTHTHKNTHTPGWLLVCQTQWDTLGAVNYKEYDELPQVL